VSGVVLFQDANGHFIIPHALVHGGTQNGANDDVGEAFSDFVIVECNVVVEKNCALAFTSRYTHTNAHPPTHPPTHTYIHISIHPLTHPLIQATTQ
jgi:hypothetical protein